MIHIFGGLFNSSKSVRQTIDKATQYQQLSRVKWDINDVVTHKKFDMGYRSILGVRFIRLHRLT